ncbi:MAG: hypothetical protein OK455_06860 [Thaumarchaeota archaeon]|nr:hypothetical protein [Nitrososphaerota archaeon]
MAAADVALRRLKRNALTRFSGFQPISMVGARKASGIFGACLLIGLLDDLQVRYLGLDRFGDGVEILYQACFMVAACATAYLVLRKESWSPVRNLSNLLLGLPVAMLADNVSIDAGTLKPYFMIIPKEGFLWRDQVFGQVPGLSQLAYWTNQQTFGNGLLNGYVLAIGVLAGYWALERAWDRHDRPQSVEPAPLLE